MPEWTLARRAQIVSSVLIALTLAACQQPSAGPPPGNGPRLRAIEAEYRGQSVEGHLRHDFVIDSTGTEPLVIRDVVSSCGCTVATPSRKEVPPGESATITVDLHVEPSRRESSVFVRSNDSATPVLELKIAATDMPDRLIQFVPALVRVRDSETAVIQSVLKVEQWKKGPTGFQFEDFKFDSSPGIEAIEPDSFSHASVRPIVWEELPVNRTDSAITVELLDRTVTLIPVRLRLKAGTDRHSNREFVRVDIPSSENKVASSILAIEVTH